MKKIVVRNSLWKKKGKSTKGIRYNWSLVIIIGIALVKKREILKLESFLLDYIPRKKKFMEAKIR